MKSLIQFIKESLVNERLNASDYLLLDTYDKAKDYFNKHYYNKDNPLEKTKFGISLEDIEYIYIIAKKYKKPAPFVGRYGSEKVFVMRRWVYSKLDEWKKLSKNDKIQPDWFWTKIRGVYAGPHNTSLKEDGSYNPSAEDMEAIIAFAVNTKLDEKLDSVQNIKFCANNKSKKQTQKEENMLNYYADEKEIFIDFCADKIVKYVGDKLHKLPSENETTSGWKEKGSYQKGQIPNKTPKTDLISSNGNYKISLKKANGAQLMSGAFNEAKATILFAAQECKLSEKEYKELENLLKYPWASLRDYQNGIRELRRDEKNKELIDGYEDAIKPINNYLKDLINPESKNYKKEFFRALLIEAISGNYKFGKSSPSAANCVLVWSENRSDNIFYPKIEDYVDFLIKENKVKVEIRWKTNDYSYQALRIETK